MKASDIGAIQAMAKDRILGSSTLETTLSPLLASAANPEVWVLEENSVILAYLILRLEGTEEEIDEIAVSKNEDRKGYGSRLMNAILRKAEETGVRKMFLEVRRSNAPAIAFYESFGFQCYRTRLHYYSDGEDALCYEKELIQ